MTTAFAPPAAPSFDAALAERGFPVGITAVPVRPDNQLFDLLDRFCTTIVKAHRLSPMTATGYRWKLGQFFMWLSTQGVGRIEQITYAHFEDFLGVMQWPNLNTRNKLVCQCRKFVRWCKARGVLANQPGDFTGDFKLESVPRGDPKSISREELELLLDGAYTYGRSGGRMAVAVGLAGLAGLRRSEIATVKWSQLNVETKRLQIVSPKIKRTGEHAIRYVPVSARLLAILLANRGDRKDDDTILDFPHFGGTAANGNRALHSLCKQVGIRPIGWHALRHTAATLLVQSGVDIEKVRQFLGHRDLVMTSIYVRGKNADLDNITDAIL